MIKEEESGITREHHEQRAMRDAEPEGVPDTWARFSSSHKHLHAFIGNDQAVRGVFQDVHKLS